MGNHIDIMTDFGFKHLFSSEYHKDFLVHFLNQVFKGRRVISELRFLRNERQSPLNEPRIVIFDLLCKGDNDEYFLVEVQRAYQQKFAERALFYGSSLIFDQRVKGTWNYNLTPVYVIGIMDFCFQFLDKGADQYMHHFLLRSPEKDEILTDKLEFIFLEIPKFKLAPDELETDLQRWLYLFKNLGKIPEIPLTLYEGIFEKVISETKIDKLSNTARMAYSESQKRKWDAYMESTNAELAEQNGYERGMAKGEAKGIAKGMAMGEAITNTKLVKSILATGKLSIAEIAVLTDLEENFIREVKASME